MSRADRARAATTTAPREIVIVYILFILQHVRARQLDFIHDFTRAERLRACVCFMLLYEYVRIKMTWTILIWHKLVRLRVQF